MQCFIIIESDSTSSTMFRFNIGALYPQIETIQELSLQFVQINSSCIVDDPKSRKMVVFFSVPNKIISHTIATIEPLSTPPGFSNNDMKKEINIFESHKEDLISNISNVFFTEHVNIKPPINEPLNAISVGDLEKNQRISELKEKKEYSSTIVDLLCNKAHTIESSAHMQIGNMQSIEQRLGSAIEKIIVSMQSNISDKLNTSKIHDHISEETSKAIKESIAKIRDTIKDKVDGIASMNYFEEAIQQIGKSLHEHIDYVVKTEMVTVFESITKQVMTEISNSIKECMSYIRLSAEKEQSKLLAAQEACIKSLDTSTRISQQISELIKTQLQGCEKQEIIEKRELKLSKEEKVEAKQISKEPELPKEPDRVVSSELEDTIVDYLLSEKDPLEEFKDAINSKNIKASFDMV